MATLYEMTKEVPYISIPTDRHTNNFGLLRDVNTGSFIGLAPNSDDNMALISRSYFTLLNCC